MKTVEKISEGATYSAVTVGKLADLKDFTLNLSPEIQIPGKVFVGTTAAMTGAELSFQIFEPGGGTPFLHTHKTHEELFIIVKGSGEFQADGKVFPIAEGSVVRVAPSAKRTLRNSGSEPMVMLCVQYKANTYAGEDFNDGQLLDDPIVW